MVGWSFSSLLDWSVGFRYMSASIVAFLVGREPLLLSVDGALSGATCPVCASIICLSVGAGNSVPCLHLSILPFASHHEDMRGSSATI